MGVLLLFPLSTSIQSYCGKWDNKNNRKVRFTLWVMVQLSSWVLWSFRLDGFSFLLVIVPIYWLWLLNWVCGNWGRGDQLPSCACFIYTLDVKGTCGGVFQIVLGFSFILTCTQASFRHCWKLIQFRFINGSWVSFNNVLEDILYGENIFRLNVVELLMFIQIVEFKVLGHMNNNT